MCILILSILVIAFFVTIIAINKGKSEETFLSEEDANLQNTDKLTNSEEKLIEFETLSVAKLFILSVATLGIYDCIWGYRQWKAIKEQTNFQCSPFLRGFFIKFTSFRLFDIILKQCYKISGHTERNRWEPNILAVAYLMIYSLSRIDNPAAFIALFAGIFPCIVQHEINVINESNPNRIINKWTFANFFWALFGLLFVFLMVVCTILQE